MNGTGTGELEIDIDTPDKIPLGANFLLQAQKAGTYSERITVKAAPDPDCDPTQRKAQYFQLIFNALLCFFSN